MKDASVILAVLFAFVTAACNASGDKSSQGSTDLASMPSGASVERLKESVRYLASDELGGRAPGSKGEELTLAYLTEQYSGMGLRPGNPDGTYVQRVPLIGTVVTNRPTLSVKTSDGSIEFPYVDDFVGWSLRKKPRVGVDDAELVFVGYGIVAPEYDWNDYKDTDVTGKIIVMLVGDPPLADETMFGGKAMTYYGRWTYKYEIAAEKKAAGAIIIHNEAAAGYPWGVVSNSWSGEQFDIERPQDGMDRCALEGWVTEDAARRLLNAGGVQLADAYEQALSRDFQPIPLAIHGSVSIENKFRNLRSYNVVAKIEGRDPQLRNEFVMYTAHWDHLGFGRAVDGDSIYNGALDNASGVAATLEIARAFAAHRDLLKRSILIMNTTAEESGLIGAYEYAAHPLYPLQQTVAEINIDGLNIWGPTKDVVVVGYGFSDLDGYLERAVASQDRYLKADTEPEKGYYYRSDHFPFAKKGVPALYADSGIEFVSRPAAWGKEMKDAYTSERYHKPQDELDASWNLDGALQDIEAYFRVGLMVAASSDYPEWSEGSEFRRVREQSLKASH